MACSRLRTSCRALPLRCFLARLAPEGASWRERLRAMALRREIGAGGPLSHAVLRQRALRRQNLAGGSVSYVIAAAAWLPASIPRRRAPFVRSCCDNEPSGVRISPEGVSWQSASALLPAGPRLPVPRPRNNERRTSITAPVTNNLVTSGRESPCDDHRVSGQRLSL